MAFSDRPTVTETVARKITERASMRGELTLEQAMELDNHECGYCDGHYSYTVGRNYIEGTCSNCGTGVSMTHEEYIQYARDELAEQEYYAATRWEQV